MKFLSLIAILTTASVSFAAPATTAPTNVKPTKITCEEFIGLEETVKPQVVYFLEGVTKSGNLEEAMITIDKVSNPVVWVAEECKKTPKATVWQKVESWVKSKTKKI